MDNETSAAPPSRARESVNATLQSYSDDLVRVLEELREKRSEVNNVIQSDEMRKSQLEAELKQLNETLHKLDVTIERKHQARDDYDKTIHETEAAYMKILESSQTLLHVLNREKANLQKKKQLANA